MMAEYLQSSLKEVVVGNRDNSKVKVLRGQDVILVKARRREAKRVSQIYFTLVLTSTYSYLLPIY